MTEASSSFEVCRATQCRMGSGIRTGKPQGALLSVHKEWGVFGNVGISQKLGEATQSPYASPSPTLSSSWCSYS